MIGVGRPARRLRLIARLLRLWLRGDLLIVDIDGASMSPALDPADRLLCARSSPIMVGSIVVRAAIIAELPVYQVKRVVGLPGAVVNGHRIDDGYAWIQGDNSATSADSRQYGPVPIEELIAVGIARLWRGGLAEVES